MKILRDQKVFLIISNLPKRYLWLRDKWLQAILKFYSHVKHGLKLLRCIKKYG